MILMTPFYWIAGSNVIMEKRWYNAIHIWYGNYSILFSIIFMKISGLLLACDKVYELFRSQTEGVCYFQLDVLSSQSISI